MMKTLPSNVWLLRDLGFTYGVLDVHRCKRLQENVEATFTDEAVYFNLPLLSILPLVISLDSDDLLYLKEQMEAEEDAERLLRRTEKRAFAAFKISFLASASLADSSPASIPLPLRVEPKPKSGIRQQDLLKKVVEVKPKRQRVSGPSDGTRTTLISSESAPMVAKSEANLKEKEPPARGKIESKFEEENPVKSLLAAYESTDDEED
ncbi:hypothetical protein LguiA_027763 [Lonicera macranthoides]